MKHLNPDSSEISEALSKDCVDVARMQQILNNTIEFIDRNSLFNYHCRCNKYYDCEKPVEKLKRSCSQRIINDSRENDCTNLTASFGTILSSSSNNSDSFHSKLWNKHLNTDKYLHRPSEEFLLNCVNLFQELFDVDCFQNVPTRMNEIYCKHGELLNFKRAAQNIIDPSMHF